MLTGGHKGLKKERRDMKDPPPESLRHALKKEAAVEDPFTLVITVDLEMN